jgi:hypothetical protein
MTEAKTPRGRTTKPQGKDRLSLYPLTIEDALRAAAKTGKPPPLSASKRANRQRKRSKPGVSSSAEE